MEAVNTNFYGRWFDPTWNRTRVYRFSSRRPIHSITDVKTLKIIKNNQAKTLFMLFIAFRIFEEELKAIRKLKQKCMQRVI